MYITYTYKLILKYLFILYNFSLLKWPVESVELLSDTCKYITPPSQMRKTAKSMSNAYQMYVK